MQVTSWVNGDGSRRSTFFCYIVVYCCCPLHLGDVEESCTCRASWVPSQCFLDWISRRWFESGSNASKRKRKHQYQYFHGRGHRSWHWLDHFQSITQTPSQTQTSAPTLWFSYRNAFRNQTLSSGKSAHTWIWRWCWPTAHCSKDRGCRHSTDWILWQGKDQTGEIDPSLSAVDCRASTQTGSRTAVTAGTTSCYGNRKIRIKSQTLEVTKKSPKNRFVVQLSTFNQCFLIYELDIWSFRSSWSNLFHWSATQDGQKIVGSTSSTRFQPFLHWFGVGRCWRLCFARSGWYGVGGKKREWRLLLPTHNGTVPIENTVLPSNSIPSFPTSDWTTDCKCYCVWIGAGVTTHGLWIQKHKQPRPQEVQFIFWAGCLGTTHFDTFCVCGLWEFTGSLGSWPEVEKHCYIPFISIL